MSLVHEALQKAEREKQRKAAALPRTPIAPPIAPLGQSAPLHPPRLAEPGSPVPQVVGSRKPVAAIEAPPRANQFLLPILIGCVAIVAIIAIVFLVSNATSALRQSKEVAPAPATVVSASTAKLPEPPPPRPSGRTEVNPATASSTPSPIAPPSAADGSKYKLSGIMKDPDGKYVAVINGRIAYEGYYIDGATVKKIEGDTATIEVNGREQLLRLF